MEFIKELEKYLPSTNSIVFFANSATDVSPEYLQQGVSNLTSCLDVYGKSVTSCIQEGEFFSTREIFHPNSPFIKFLRSENCPITSINCDYDKDAAIIKKVIGTPNIEVTFNQTNSHPSESTHTNEPVSQIKTLTNTKFLD